MDDVNEIIKNKFNEMGLVTNNLTQKQFEYLIKIENLISIQMREQERLLEQMKKLGFSLKSISENVKISYQTFYNNPILKTYVEYSISEFSSKNPYRKIDIMKDTINNLENKCTKMEYRDLGIELMKNEMGQLKTRLKNKEREVLQLRNQNKKIANKLSKIDKTCDRKEAEIINLDF